VSAASLRTVGWRFSNTNATDAARSVHFWSVMATAPAERCRRRFLRFFPDGFRDETYLEWERNYKADAARAWQATLAAGRFKTLLEAGRYGDIAAEAIRIESRTNLLFSFEKMALRDAVRQPTGARRFAEGLFTFLHVDRLGEEAFERWAAAVARLPRRQTRVLTWPLVTVFAFIADPARHIFLKPNVTRIAAERYGATLGYESRPNWQTYRDLLTLAATVRRDLADLRPRDMVDVQSFLWVQGSEEYRGRTFRAVHTTRRPSHKSADRWNRSI
jgi:hypothetical protein